MRVPLLYKAGILRDGTTFQDEYCVDGQWIRFVGGKIKKMKGQRELINSPKDIKYLTVLFVNNVTYLFYATEATVNRLTLNLTTNTLTDNIKLLTNEINKPLVTWTSVVFIKDLKPCIAFLKTCNAINMLSNYAGTLSWKPLNDGEELVDAPIGPNANLISGGILFSSPCLYLYGNNGTILRSSTENPLKFDGGDSAIYTISSDKLIFGASVRGGSNAPSFLFWTANSVIYLTNVADGRDVKIPVDFQKEVVTNNSSLMSSRSIVQYDSLFFWLGTDRIFVYNGIVDSIPNTINLEYFFDNVDLSKRQLIFGYKIARYGEIRWAYPEVKYAGSYAVGCTRELVYNVRENSWYDTAIQRDCVTVYEGTGDIFSYGDSCTNYPYKPNENYKGIWRQEVGVAEVRKDGSTKPIPSFFTTPFYGFVTFNPTKNGDAIEKYIVLDQIEPDFPVSPPYERTEADTLEITVNYQKYAGTSITRTAPITFNLANLPGEGNPNLGKIDFRVQGRFMNITFSCSYPYDVGTVLMNFKEGDSQ
jgi:hypothetical protein